MEIFEIILGQNLIQIYTKTHQIAAFKFFFGGAYHRTPDMQISQSEKKILPPPPAKSWVRLWNYVSYVSEYHVY